MVEINPETQKTRQERLATVIAIGVSAFFHIFVFIGGIQLYKWAEEEERRDRLMVIHRVPEAPPREQRPSAPAPARPQAPAEAKIEKEAPDPPTEDSAVSDEGEPSDLVDEEAPVEEAEELSETIISVRTNKLEATFTVTGPIEFHGRNYKIHKGAPPGSYSATFHPLPGFKTPPIQTATLEEKGSIDFKGIYGETYEVSVKINSVPGATFDIVDPNGIKLGIHTPGKTFFEDLPVGTYRIVWHDVPGYITPAPQSKSFGRGGGGLDFEGRYLPAGMAKKKQAPKKVAEASLDKRVKMVVKSYPQTSIEENFDYIRYPEIIIRRSNFQSGWCRVYLVLKVDGSGRISGVEIERPRAAERAQYQSLIGSVESAVRRWRYDNTPAEVHVDVRFYVE